MKYASVYLRKRSPFFYIVYWSVPRQKRVHEATPFLRSDTQGRRKALALAYEKSKVARADKEIRGADRWEFWAGDFLQARYKGRTKTLDRMVYAWEQWQDFLREEECRVPRALDYNAVLKFIAWRSGQVKRSGKRVSKNTALCDVRVMSVLMREALRRGFAETNHCERLGIEKDPAKQKPEMSEAEIAKIRQALRTRPEWMRVSFEIALHQGCRLSETSLALTAVDVPRRSITFAAKGRGHGEKHIFTTKLHEGLVPLMNRLQAAKKKNHGVTCTLPRMAAKQWHSFFQEMGLGHLCFHCTRVTVITRMARAGVPISQAMAYVGHASETIHRIYQRLAHGDLGAAVAALSFSSASATDRAGG